MSQILDNYTSIVDSTESSSTHELPRFKNLNESDIKKESITQKIRLEVCIDSLESAMNAVKGGASELEVCSSLVEGGLTPSPGLVIKVISIVQNFKNNVQSSESADSKKIKVNVMIRCRGGSDFCYTEDELDTMLTDIRHYKTMAVDSFVFGALTNAQEIDEEICSRIVAEAHPKPVTFHRAFDLCKNPNVAIKKIIALGFKRLLTSGQSLSAANDDAVELIKKLQTSHGNIIEIMPGAGVTPVNVTKFLDIGCRIVHSSCKMEKERVIVEKDLAMGNPTINVTSVDIVSFMVRILNEYNR